MTTPQLKRSAEITLALGCAAGGAAASLTLVSATTGTYNESPTWHVLYDSAPAVQAAGAAVAVLTASSRVSGTSRILTAMIATIILFSTIAGTTNDSILVGYTTSVLAGVILGSLAGWSLAVAPWLGWAPAALAVGTVTGVVVHQPLSDPFVLYPGGDGPTPAISVDSVTRTLLLISVVLAAALNPRVRTALSSVPESAEDLLSPRVCRRAAVLGVALAAMSVLTYWWYTATVISDSDSVNEWYLGYTQLAAILIVAMVLGRRGGAILMVAAAWTASRSGDTNWVPDHRAWLLAVTAAIIFGAVLGRRFGRPVIGVAVLAACSATYLLLHAPFTQVYSATVLFVAPGAAAFAVAGAMRGTRSAAAALAIALAGPAFWIFAPRSHFIAIGYVGSERPESFDISGSYGPHSLSSAAEVAVPMIIAIVGCGVVLQLILRRATDDAPRT